MDCTVLVDPDGRYAFGGRHFVEAEYESLLGEMRKSCMKKGASSWTNTAQKDAATRDVLVFPAARLAGNRGRDMSHTGRTQELAGPASV
jgi:hypothetical protein